MKYQQVFGFFITNFLIQIEIKSIFENIEKFIIFLDFLKTKNFMLNFLDKEMESKISINILSNS